MWAMNILVTNIFFLGKEVIISHQDFHEWITLVTSRMSPICTCLLVEVCFICLTWLLCQLESGDLTDNNLYWCSCLSSSTHSIKYCQKFAASKVIKSLGPWGMLFFFFSPSIGRSSYNLTFLCLKESSLNFITMTSMAWLTVFSLYVEKKNPWYPAKWLVLLCGCQCDIHPWTLPPFSEIKILATLIRLDQGYSSSGGICSFFLLMSVLMRIFLVQILSSALA